MNARYHRFLLNRLRDDFGYSGATVRARRAQERVSALEPDTVRAVRPGRRVPARRAAVGAVARPARPRRRRAPARQRQPRRDQRLPHARPRARLTVFLLDVAQGRGRRCSLPRDRRRRLSRAHRRRTRRRARRRARPRLHAVRRLQGRQGRGDHRRRDARRRAGRQPGRGRGVLRRGRRGQRISVGSRRSRALTLPASSGSLRSRGGTRRPRSWARSSAL